MKKNLHLPALLVILVISFNAMAGEVPGLLQPKLKKSTFLTTGELTFGTVEFTSVQPVTAPETNEELVIASPAPQVGAGLSAIKINYISPILRTLSIFYEQTISDNMSLQLGFYYTGFGVDEVKYRGYAITPEFRFYPSDEAIDGFFIAPFFRYRNLSISADYTYVDEYGDLQSDKGKAVLNTFGGGILVGNQWIFNDLISFELFIGPQMSVGNAKLVDGDETYWDYSTRGFNGFGVRLGTTVGICF